MLGLPRGQDIPVPVLPDGERVLFLSDWFNREANVIGMQLNRCVRGSGVRDMRRNGRALVSWCSVPMMCGEPGRAAAATQAPWKSLDCR